MKEEGVEGAKFMGLLFLMLAVILLLFAAILNPRKTQWGQTLFIFGDILLVLGVVIYLKGGKRE